MLRRLLSGLGVLIALLLVAISCTLSYQFSSQLGGTPLEATAYGTAAVGIDLLKCLMPFFLMERIREGRYAAATAAGVLLVLGIIWSFTSAMGLAAQNRMGRVTTIETRQAEFREAGEAIARLQKQQATILRSRAALEITAEIDASLASVMTVGRKTDSLGALTTNCTKPTRSTAEACNTIGALKLELASASEWERIDQRIAEHRRTMSRLRHDGAGESSTPDVQAHFIGRAMAALTGTTTNIGLIQLMLVAFVALVLEAGSSCGLYVALGSHRLTNQQNAPEPTQPPDTILSFCIDRLMPMPNHAITVTDAFRDYVEWCARTKQVPLGRREFCEALKHIAKTHGLTIKKRRLHHVGLGDQATYGNEPGAQPQA